MAKIKKSHSGKKYYAIYDCSNYEFVTPICSEVEELESHLVDLNSVADYGDYIIYMLTETDLQIKRAGWVIE